MTRPETEMGEANDQREYIDIALTHFTEETKKCLSWTGGQTNKQITPKPETTDNQ